VGGLTGSSHYSGCRVAWTCLVALPTLPVEARW